MIAPIIVTVIMVLYYAVYFGFLISLLEGMWRYILGIVPLAFSILMIKVCIERIKEIKDYVLQSNQWVRTQTFSSLIGTREPPLELVLNDVKSSPCGSTNQKIYSSPVIHVLCSMN